jgi:hypothetical protein
MMAAPAARHPVISVPPPGDEHPPTDIQAQPDIEGGGDSCYGESS